nr:MAG TPA: baseplate protein [Bacteriophage sp.]
MADDILKNIPLPADLPENWTSGQIIAPTGAEAGLDEQHGYNYLMRQVNNAQKALKALAAQRKEDLARIKFWASDDPTSPASFIGGTWERIEGKFIMGASDTYPAGSTGGSATHTQTEDEVASHAHFVTASGNTDWNLWSDSNLGLAYSSKYTFEFSTTSNLNGRSNERGFVGTDYTGNGKPMDIINPYYSMCIWRRVA